jgi:hypothetical protein
MPGPFDENGRPVFATCRRGLDQINDAALRDDDGIVRKERICRINRDAPAGEYQ